MRRRIGPTSRFAQASPSQIAENSIVSASITNTVAKPSSRLWRCASNRPNRAETLAASSATFAASGSMLRAAYRNCPSAPGIGRMPTNVLPTPSTPQSASPRLASSKSDGSGLAMSFSFEPSAICSVVPSLFMSAAAPKPSVFEREPKYSLNWAGSSRSRRALRAMSPAVNSTSRRSPRHCDSRKSWVAWLASLMKAATSVMNLGLIAHSTETAATIAVTIAGIAATREKSATNRLWRRAPARAARRAARSLTSSMPMSVMSVRTTRKSPRSNAKTTFAVGRIGVSPAKIRNVASASTKAAPTATGPNRAVGPLSLKGAAPRAPMVVVPVKTLNRTARHIRRNHRRPWQ